MSAPERRGSELGEDVRAWVEEVSGGRLQGLRRSAAGGSRATYLADVEVPRGGTVPLILRMEAGGAFAGTEVDVAREASVYRALAETAVPVPKVIGLAPGGRALLLERLAGTDDLGSMADDERHRVMEDFVDVLAGLHSVDVESLDLPGIPRPGTPEEHARLDLRMWERLTEQGVPDPDPLICYAAALLDARAPASVSRTVLVHGDAGPGNFLAEAGRVTGLVDMEFAHLGDPMDDVAWLEMRSASHGVEIGGLLERYAERSGIDVDRAGVDYYGMVVQYRCAITTSLAVARGGGALGLPPYLLATQRYLLALARSLVAWTGAGETEVEVPEVPETPRTRWYDQLEDAIRTGVRGIEDPELRERTRLSQILVHYLRAHDRLGPRIQELERADAEASLGIAADDHAGLRAAAGEAGAAGDAEVLRYLARRTRRRASLWSTLLDRRRSG